MRGRRRKPVSGALIRLLLALTIISSLITSSYSIRLPSRKMITSSSSSSLKKLMGFRNRAGSTTHRPAAVTSDRKKNFKWIRNRMDVLPIGNNKTDDEQHNTKKTKSKKIFRIPLPFPLMPNKKKKTTPKQEVVHQPEAYLNSVEIIKYRGYPAQIYHVTTDDGYILEVHRIPHGKGQSVDAGATGSPVFLQHGFMDSDAGWLLSSNERSLAFRLADAGYDVWLGNARGNTYSTRHTTLDTSQEPYWNFSYDEMGKYDIPAVINYVLSVTGRSTMSYVGHSMGCAMFFIAMTYHPELNAKINVMIALAPATNLSHMRSPVRFLTPFVTPIELTLELFQVRQFLRNDALFPRLQRRFCDVNVRWQGLCRNVLLATVGDDSSNMPLEVLSLIDHHSPAGTSLHTTAMLAQNHNSGDTFVPYDFGIIGNLQRYGQWSPPPYDLSKVTCKVYLFYGPNDLLVVPEDVAWLASQLPNLQASIQVNYYNHFDFLYATDNNQFDEQVISYLPSST